MFMIFSTGKWTEYFGHLGSESQLGCSHLEASAKIKMSAIFMQFGAPESSLVWFDLKSENVTSIVSQFKIAVITRIGFFNI